MFIRTALIFILFVLSFSSYGNGFSTVGLCSPLSISADSSGQKIFLALRRGGFWSTNDGGDHWLPMDSMMTNSRVIFPNNIKTFDVDSEVIVADFFGLEPTDGITGHCSMDGGTTWMQFDLHDIWPPTPYYSNTDHLIFAHNNPYRIYNAKISGCGYSIDGGTNWDVTLYDDMMRSITGIYLEPQNPDTVYVFGAWNSANEPGTGGVLATHDGGVSWQRLTPMELLDEGSGRFVDIERLPNGNLLALTSWYPNSEHPPFLISSDDGETWDWQDAQGLPAIARTSDFLAIPEIPGKMLLAFAGPTGIYQSTDYGLTWTRLLNGLPDRAQIPAIYRNPESGTLYVGFFGQGIFRSTDYGESWQSIPPPPVGMESMVYHGIVPDQTGVNFAGYDGTLWHANEDATVFSQVAPAIEPEFTEWIEPVVSRDGNVLASRKRRSTLDLHELFTILRSADGGVSWEETPVMEYYDYKAPLFVNSVPHDSGYGLVGISAGDTYVHLSSDSGMTWSRHDIGFFIAHVESYDGIVYAIDHSYGDVVRSSDLGQTWEGLNFPDGMTLLASSTPIVALDDTLYVRADDRMWVHTPDEQWTSRNSLPLYDAPNLQWDIVAGALDTFVVAGAQNLSRIIVSYDMGHSWQDQELGFTYQNQGMSLVDIAYDPWRNRLWIDTGVGLAYFDNPSAAVGEDRWLFQPADYLTVNAFPNPFNSSTSVRVTLQKPGELKLDVYDILGRLVTSLTDAHVPAGTHEVQFDATDLASGSYFLRADVNGQTISRKLTLLK